MESLDALLLDLQEPKGIEKETRRVIYREVPLDEEVMLIGRHKDCEINVPKDFVSSSHAKIEHTEGDYFITDVGSTNGTYVQRGKENISVKLERKKPFKLDEGDTIYLGAPDSRAYKFQFRFTEKPKLIDLWEFEGPEGEPLIMKAMKVNTQRKMYSLGQKASLGSSLECTIRSSQPGVSPYHATLERRGERGYFIILNAPGHIEDQYGKRKIVPKPHLPYQLDDDDHIILGNDRKTGAVYQFSRGRRRA